MATHSICVFAAVLLGSPAAAYAIDDGDFRPATSFATGVAPANLATGDFNGDTYLDVATADDLSGLTVLLGDGKGSVSPAPSSPEKTSLGALSVATCDFNRDGVLDLVAADIFSDEVTLMIGNGRGDFEAASGSPFPAHSASWVECGDLNSDLLPDLGGPGRDECRGGAGKDKLKGCP